MIKKIIGCLIIMRLNADENDDFTFDYALKMIEKYNVSNFFIYGKNTDNWINFTKEIRKYLKNEPLFCADFERGTGCNANKGTDFPGNMALCATDEPNYAFLQGQAIAKEMKYFGLNWNLAPCIDGTFEFENAVIGIRAFGDNIYKISEFGLNFSNGLENENILSCIKHFPGHGSVKEDTHNELPSIDYDLQFLEKRDLYPFKYIIKNGKVSSLMLAHIHIKSMDEKVIPASCSNNAISFIRKNYRYSGLVIPDAIEMEGIRKLKTSYGISAEVLKAGCDLLLAPKNIERTIYEIKKAVDEGYITEKLLLQKVNFVNKFREKLSSNKYYCENFDWNTHKAISQRIANVSICEKNFKRTIKPCENIVIINYYDDHCQFLTIWKDQFLLKEKLKKEGFFNVKEIFVSNKEKTIKEKINIAKFDVVILALYQKIILGGKNEKKYLISHMNFFREFYKANRENFIIISFGVPFIHFKYLFLNNSLFAFSNSISSHNAIIKILKGELKPSGKFPVNVKLWL